MELYDAETGRMLPDSPINWTDRLQALWNDMISAGASPHDAAYFIIEHATCFRCDETLRRTFLKKKA